MPPSRSTSSAFASVQADSRSDAVAPKFPARLTTRTPWRSRRSRAIATCSGVAQRQFRCASQRSIASNPAADDRREQLVEAGAEGLDRLEGGVRRHVERAPFVGSAVAQLLGDVVRAHEREGQRR